MYVCKYQQPSNPGPKFAPMASTDFLSLVWLRTTWWPALFDQSFSTQSYSCKLTWWFRASSPILQNAGWIILTISSSQLVCKPGDPPMTCVQGDINKEKTKARWIWSAPRKSERNMEFVLCCLGGFFLFVLGAELWLAKGPQFPSQPQLPSWPYQQIIRFEGWMGHVCKLPLTI